MFLGSELNFLQLSNFDIGMGKLNFSSATGKLPTNSAPVAGHRKINDERSRMELESARHLLGRSVK